MRRRIGIEILELIEMSAQFMTKGGWTLLNKHTYPNRAVFRNASKRLRDQGLIVRPSEGGRNPKLMLTDLGRSHIPAYFTPEKYWNVKWNGIWNMIVYDVPEVDRKYRNVLRSFLKRLRMGCLQQSVWVTPFDIRPEFDDLSETANVDVFAYLFEARTVLGLSSQSVVESAWDFERLQSLQEHYCSVCRKNTELLTAGLYPGDELAELTRFSIEAFHGAFVEDPLLPSTLLPAGYLGKEVFSTHVQLMKTIGEQIACVMK